VRSLGRAARPLGRQAVRAIKDRAMEVWKKPLAGGHVALGLLNRGPATADCALTWSDIALAPAFSPALVRTRPVSGRSGVRPAMAAHQRRRQPSTTAVRTRAAPHRVPAGRAPRPGLRLARPVRRSSVRRVEAAARRLRSCRRTSGRLDSGRAPRALEPLVSSEAPSLRGGSATRSSHRRTQPPDRMRTR
jgi:hypothetical protein